MLTTFHSSKLLMLRNSVIIAISRHEVLKLLGVWFMPFANSVCDTKYRKRFTSFTHVAVVILFIVMVCSGFVLII